MARVIIGLCIAAALAGCDAEREFGERFEFLGEPVALSADTDEDEVSRVIVTVPDDVVQLAPLRASTAVEESSPFPEEAIAQTFTDFFEIAWRPTGDVLTFPEPFFALRYYGIPREQVEGITCENQPDVAPGRIPTGFDLIPLTEPGACIPGQGRRATKAGDQIVFGFDQGQLVLIEAQLSRDLLLDREPFVVPIPRPEEVGQATRFPTRLIANFRSDIDAWEFSMEEFEDVL